MQSVFLLMTYLTGFIIGTAFLSGSTKNALIRSCIVIR